MRKTAFIIALAFLASTSFAQLVSKPTVIRIKQIPKSIEKPQPAVVSFSEDRSDVHVVYAQILENGDTLLTVNLPEVDIDLMQRYNQIIETKSGQRLAFNVKKVYPYALIARKMMHEYDSLLAREKTASARRELMKKAEDDLTERYTEELKNLNFSQGLILIRLIDRETGDSSYEVVQQLRGKFRAFFYQGFARLWGYNLKSEFDPHKNQEDDDIETIIAMIERGIA
ncbi:MAG: DUF4294 domain-containing protein [Bacteroidales bacterium]|nr:DUF4294 domain-containing protein [Bacteroidales bacterium]